MFEFMNIKSKLLVEKAMKNGTEFSKENRRRFAAYVNVTGAVCYYF